VGHVRILRRKTQSIYMWRNIQLVRTRVLLFASLLLLAFLLFILNIFPYASLGLIMLPLAYVLGVYSYRSYLTWLGGLEGEEMVSNALKELDDSYILLNGLVVPPNRGDTDNIIVGPNGFFVVESKNYGGRISCNGDEWKKVRVWGDKVYNLEIGSPSNQVKRNAKVLKDFILAHQREIFAGVAPHVWIHGVLVFTNPDAEVELQNPTIAVVELDELCDHIRSTKSEYSLSAAVIDSTGQVLQKYAR
jgi:hypothetical protein